MSMISDPDYILQAIRLSALRTTDDPLTPRIISLDPSFALNPYINASGLSDVDRWPEIKRALDSPPPETDGYSSDDRPRRRGGSGSDDRSGGGLKYTQTIMGGRTGALGMRVTGRQGRERKESRANSSSAAGRTTSPIAEGPKAKHNGHHMDGTTTIAGRPRADSAPAPNLLAIRPFATAGAGTSMITTGRGLGVPGGDTAGSLLERALSVSETSGDIEEDEMDDRRDSLGFGAGGFGAGSLLGEGGSAQPSDLGLIGAQSTGPFGETMVDEGSDVDEDEIEEEGNLFEDTREVVEPLRSIRTSARSSVEVGHVEEIIFTPVSIRPRSNGSSALTAALNKHIPHLVSTATSPTTDTSSPPNPFASLYISVAAPHTHPSVSLEIYFPHSSSPATPMPVQVRKEATVEEVTGYGLYKFWEEQRDPLLSEQESEQRWSTVGWGLRIVEDDGEVDEDFPPLDRDSQVTKFSYGQFAIVEATESQVQQNLAKAPHIQRRPSRIIAQPTRTRSAVQGGPSFSDNGQQQQAQQQQMSAISVSADMAGSFLSSSELHLPSALGASQLKGSVGLSSALSKPVLLRVRVTASADVHFTTTISVPSDMYIADLTEVLCKKKRLQNPASDWVLCLADLTLALPLDRTVASLEGRTDLALVRRQWAVEHGMRIGDRRGGDPSASIFKRMSELAPLAKFGAGVTDASQTYKKYHVQRKIAIGGHDRLLAIDGDYIHIMPTETRAFFHRMKTTSFHITLVASCKLTGRAGGFKINVWRDGGQKRYEFEADSGKQAAEIISSIRQLMRSYQAERNSMLPPPQPGPQPDRR